MHVEFDVFGCAVTTINGYLFVLNGHLSISYKSMLIYKIVGVDFDLALGINLSAIDIFRCAYTVPTHGTYTEHRRQAWMWRFTDTHWWLADSLFFSFSIPSIAIFPSDFSMHVSPISQHSRMFEAQVNCARVHFVCVLRRRAHNLFIRIGVFSATFISHCISICIYRRYVISIKSICTRVVHNPLKWIRSIFWKW